MLYKIHEGFTNLTFVLVEAQSEAAALKTLLSLVKDTKDGVDSVLLLNSPGMRFTMVSGRMFTVVLV